MRCEVCREMGFSEQFILRYGNKLGDSVNMATLGEKLDSIDRSILRELQPVATCRFKTSGRVSGFPTRRVGDGSSA